MLLLGPRQTGQSTLVKSLKPELSINLANEREFLRHSADPGLLESLIVGQTPLTVFIDEVQRLPSLLNNVQDLIDNPRGGHRVTFYLAGSTARKLRRADTNLLPGRLFTYRLGGLCAQELNYERDIERALRTGFSPRAVPV
jgi:predicted AAA+ superfamily ATPase